MVEGRCKRARHVFDVGAKNKKHALEILKKEFNKTSKYSIVYEHSSDLGIPVGSFIQRL